MNEDYPESQEDDTRVTNNDTIIDRRRFRELRQRMQTEDDDIPINSSPPDSQTSSIEGVYPTPSKTSHPFRIIEHDTLSMQSMTSLGRVGRILAGGLDSVSGIVQPGQSSSTTGNLTRSSQMSSIASIPSRDDEPPSGKVSQSSSVLTLSGDVLQESSVNGRSDYPNTQEIVAQNVVLQEPDVIASTKNNGKPIEIAAVTSGVSGAPVAPPRRKKKSKPQTPTDLAVRFFKILSRILFSRIRKIAIKIQDLSHFPFDIKHFFGNSSLIFYARSNNSSISSNI